MKKLSIISLFILYNNFILAQERTYKVKLYNNLSYTLKSNNLSQNFKYKTNYMQFIKLMPAFSWQKNKNEHEIILNTIEKNKTVYKEEYVDSLSYLSNEFINNYFNIRLNYIYHLNLKIFRNEKVKTFLGLNCEPFFNHGTSKLSSSFAFPTVNTNLGLNFYLQPRLTYKLNNKFNLEFNVPIDFVDFNNNFRTIRNPAFSARQQTTKTMDFNIAPNHFQLNFGLALKI